MPDLTFSNHLRQIRTAVPIAAALIAAVQPLVDGSIELVELHRTM